MARSIRKWLGHSILFSYIAVLILIGISNLGVFDPNWPFELFASFSRQVALILPLAAIVGFFIKRRYTLILLLAAMFAFWPLTQSSKYKIPQSVSCDQQVCITVIFANARDSEASLSELNKLAEKRDGHVLAMSELPPNISVEKLSETFSSYPYTYLAAHADDGRALGSTMGIVSRYPLKNTRLVVENYPRWPRSIIVTQIQLESETSLDLLITHPRIPLSHAGMRRRDDVFKKLNELTAVMDQFVIMGDFNVTPWTPAFKKLPGLRAGDPRLQSTWAGNFQLLGLPIDHILISSEIAVVQSETLDDIGSDHKPIFAQLKIQ